jgi:SHS2 domain-containing protein
MSHSYKFIDHTADIAVELSGDSLEELFIAGSKAWHNAVSDEIVSDANDSVEFDLSANSKEELLVSFLNELNFLFTTQKWLCLKVASIKIIEDGSCELSAELNGIKVQDDFPHKQEIKSVTYHQMEIVKKERKYSTLVVFDI